MNYWDIYMAIVVGLVVILHYARKRHDSKSLQTAGKLLSVLAVASLLPYFIFTSLSNLENYKNEFLIPLKEGCYYGEGVNVPKVNLSLPLEGQGRIDYELSPSSGDFSMGYEKVVRCWTMNDYGLNETMIDDKIEDIENDKHQLLKFVILLPFMNAIAILMINAYKNIRPKDTNIYKGINPN